MKSMSSNRLSVGDEAKVFVTQESGLITPVYPRYTRVEQEVQTIDISSPISAYDLTQQTIPVSRKTLISMYFEEAFTFPIAEKQIPEKGKINIAIRNYAYTTEYFVAEWNYPSHTSFEVVLVAGYGLLEGEHAPKIHRVRFDLGDGTYKELYAHEKEIGLQIERYYNRVNLWN